ncbi:Ubiquitin-like protein atg12 [Podospora australis]|uniref:Ubiquitin-like protein ATG12 n=1 Tax=Podospora australis TaxID=1536484 RepID=A0AAN6WTG2_9PEZI|nr:Ubiquitin-like protein atg12 [Podospora australis]
MAPSSPPPGVAAGSPSPILGQAAAAPDESQPASPVLEGRDSPELPLTMTTSTMLMTLPRDASAALAAAGGFPREKVTIRFRPVGAASVFRRDRVNVLSEWKFESVVSFVRKQLKVTESDSVFLYINSTFAPALDEVVGNLWRCFKDANDYLNVSYSITPAFG